MTSAPHGKGSHSCRDSRPACSGPSRASDRSDRTSIHCAARAGHRMDNPRAARGPHSSARRANRKGSHRCRDARGGRHACLRLSETRRSNRCPSSFVSRSRRARWILSGPPETIRCGRCESSERVRWKPDQNRTSRARCSARCSNQTASARGNEGRSRWRVTGRGRATPPRASPTMDPPGGHGRRGGSMPPGR